MFNKIVYYEQNYFLIDFYLSYLNLLQYTLVNNFLCNKIIANIKICYVISKWNLQFQFTSIKVNVFCLFLSKKENQN